MVRYKDDADDSDKVWLAFPVVYVPEPAAWPMVKDFAPWVAVAEV